MAILMTLLAGCGAEDMVFGPPQLGDPWGDGGGGGTTPREPDRPQPWTSIAFWGTVSSAADGAPIEGAVVYFRSDLADGSSNRADSTDAYGYYRLQTRCDAASEGWLIARATGWHNSERVLTSCSPQGIDFVLEPTD